jgi:peptidoglycan/LPS O-acetylase OafA/YrhL
LNNLSYISQLNTIRAIAVTLVLFQHWLPKEHWINSFNNGLIGVVLFFVLSGFLITRILLELKNEDAQVISFWKKIKLFYIRRSLRIFPIYYLILSILFVCSFQQIREQFLYFATYTQNFLFVSNDDNFGYLIHFWSLAVEEQFYLFWPFIILWIPQKYLSKTMFLFIALSFTFRIIIDIFLSHKISPSSYLMPGAIDAFAMGGLLALFLFNNSSNKYLNPRNVLLTIPIMIILHYLKVIDYYLLIAFLSSVTIYFVVRGKGTIFNFIFNNKFLLLYGKISYGIYLIHYLIYPLNHWLHIQCIENNIRIPILNKVLIPEIANDYLKFIYFFIFTFVLATFSWFIIEQPFNRIKNKFNY